MQNQNDIRKLFLYHVAEMWNKQFRVKKYYNWNIENILLLFHIDIFVHFYDWYIEIFELSQWKFKYFSKI